MAVPFRKLANGRYEVLIGGMDRGESHTTATLALQLNGGVGSRVVPGMLRASAAKCGGNFEHSGQLGSELHCLAVVAVRLHLGGIQGLVLILCAGQGPGEIIGPIGENLGIQLGARNGDVAEALIDEFANAGVLGGNVDEYFLNGRSL